MSQPVRQLVVGLAASTLALCGGGCGEAPFCGDGNVDQGEECDDGNNNDETDACLSTCLVRPVPTLIVKWSFNVDEDRGFDGDSCTDTGAREVTVDIDGPVAEAADESCSFRQVTFSDIPAGTYDLDLAVRDRDGRSLTSSAVGQSYEFGGGDEEITVNVPYDAWSANYTGNFFFNVTYGGLGCDPATNVVQQSLFFTYDDGGRPVAGYTKAGDPLDGSPSDCYSKSENEPQTILDVPFGPATLVVQGLDAEANVVYESSFPTFIGAGLLNDEVSFDVAPSL
ncbi:MAG: hypothetical protein KJO07_07295 [Deltaproteobacteria bacterium]|jgi:cysteine-rich repeat protein|nr:hypothetical protein [Deltaproteobacteria bacterium]